MNFYSDFKWCEKCRKYVLYLVSLDSSHCIYCDAKVVVYNRADLKRFHRTPLLPEAV